MIYYQDLKIGDFETHTTCLTQERVNIFADVTGDTNPVHVNPDYAKNTMFKGTIAHGMFTASLISTILGTKFPGPGVIFVSQSTKFTAPVMCGDEVTARVEVLEMSDRKKFVTMKCTCTVGEKTVLKGEAVVKVPSREE